MRLLLDTHVVIWSDIDSPRLGPEARRAISEAEEVFVSAASEWEVAIKQSSGKMVAERTLKCAAEDAGYELLAVTFEHAQKVRELPAIHRDPFDRLLVAVALTERLTLVSSDLIIRDYPVPFLNAQQ